MKRLIILIIVFVSYSNLIAQDSLGLRYWTKGTAFCLPKHRIELGFLDESRYGLTNSIELSSNLPLGFLMPVFNVKKNWANYHGFNIATQHGFFYPTIFLRTVSKEGIGGLISPEFYIPPMISFSNQFFISFVPLKYTILSAYTGINLAILSGKLDHRTSIDLPYIYPRLAVFYKQPEIDIGFDFRGVISKCFGWKINTDHFIFFNTAYNYFSESSLIISYSSSKQTLRINSGAKLCFGKYLSGTQWHLLPVLTLAFKI